MNIVLKNKSHFSQDVERVIRRFNDELEWRINSVDLLKDLNDDSFYICDVDIAKPWTIVKCLKDDKEKIIYLIPAMFNLCIDELNYYMTINAGNYYKLFERDKQTKFIGNCEHIKPTMVMPCICDSNIISDYCMDSTILR